MNKKSIVLIAFISLLSAGCATTPKEGEVIFAKVTHIFEEAEYRDAIKDKESFKGFFGKKKLSMLEAAIHEGITNDDVTRQRLIVCECSCGPDCYTSVPVLLPVNTVINLYDLIELTQGANKWHGDIERYSYTLGNFERRIDVPLKNWARIEGNHNYLPACSPAKWKQ